MMAKIASTVPAPTVMARGEVKQSTLNTHPSSVNSDGAICNITLVSMVVQSLSHTGDSGT